MALAVTAMRTWTSHRSGSPAAGSAATMTTAVKAAAAKRLRRASAGRAPAQSIQITFPFQKAGQVTLAVPVAAPASNVPVTSSYNFNQEEGTGSTGGEGSGAGATQTGGHG